MKKSKYTAEDLERVMRSWTIGKTSPMSIITRMMQQMSQEEIDRFRAMFPSEMQESTFTNRIKKLYGKD